MPEVKIPITEIGYIDQNFQKAFDYWGPDRKRMWRNGRMFFGVDYGQWPDYVVSQLIAEERQAPTFNICDNKIFNLIGLILKNKLDIKFAGMTDEFQDLILKLQDMWYSDYELGNWDGVFSEFIRDMAVMVGFEQMGIDKTIDPMGSITFRTLNPFLVTLDPNWQTPFAKDLERYWYHPMLNITEILNIWPSKRPEMQEEFERQKIDKTYGPNRMYPELNPEERWGDKHRCVEEHYMETETDMWEFDLKNREWFPDVENETKLQYARLNGLSQDDIQFQKRTRRIHKVRTVCPGLSQAVYLENGKSIIQIGKTDLFPLGYARYNGHFKGIIDTLYDVQQNINKGIMDMVDIRQRTARGGAALLDPDIVGSDKARMDEIESKWNVGGYKGWVKAGAFSGGKDKYILQLPEANISQDYMALTNMMIELGDRLSFIPAAQQGMTESSKESGRLFQSKYEAGIISQGNMYKNLEMHWHDKADAYVTQARITYAGQKRRFNGYEGKPGFTINDNEALPGQVINDISRLPRIKVTITQSPKGLNVRTNKRMIYSELMHSLPKNLQIMPIVLAEGIFSTIEMPEQEKNEIKYLIGLEKQVAEANSKNSIAQAQLAEQTAKMQLQAIMQQGQGNPADFAASGGMGGPQGGGGPAIAPPNMRGQNTITPQIRGPQEQQILAAQGTPQQVELTQNNQPLPGE